MGERPVTSLSVIIARIQVDDLHEGHLELFQEAFNNSTTMLVIIGLSPCKCTRNNPLDFSTRCSLVLSHFPKAKVAYIEDIGDNIKWSKKLDTIIKPFADKHDTTILYGSRDSFIKSYHGTYLTKNIMQKVIISGTVIRNQIAARSRDTVDFRAGAIWYALNQYPRVVPTVDIAVIDKSSELLLLGRKPHEDLYRLVGGFAEPGETFEASAVRELQEETGLRVKPGQLHIERSFFIDDWRYKNEVDKITTVLFTLSTYSGLPIPNDDICELKWFNMYTELTLDIVMPNHRDMIAYLIKKYCPDRV